MEKLYNELLKAYTKEALASMIKADIRSRFPEPYAKWLRNNVLINRISVVYSCYNIYKYLTQLKDHLIEIFICQRLRMILFGRMIETSF